MDTNEAQDVTVAKDGQEAFEVVKESMESDNLFNLIFMDIQVRLTLCIPCFGEKINLPDPQMPNLDGLQSTRMIRQMGYSAPIIALTAFAEESNVKECKSLNLILPPSHPTPLIHLQASTLA